MKKNYQIELEKILKEQCSNQERVPTLLLHSCCAPCSSYVLEYLSNYFSITVYYYNPNIYPKEEFYKRLKEQEEFVKKLPVKHKIRVLSGDFEDKLFYDKIRGLEDCKEGGERCKVCFRMRLEASAKIAKEHDFDYFTTTLTISPLKNSQVLNALGMEIGEQMGVAYLPSDFKKKGGYLRSIELSKEYKLYRQDYCGCVFSKRERMEQMKEKESEE